MALRANGGPETTWPMEASERRAVGPKVRLVNMATLGHGFEANQGPIRALIPPTIIWALKAPCMWALKGPWLMTVPSFTRERWKVTGTCSHCPARLRSLWLVGPQWGPYGIEGLRAWCSNVDQAKVMLEVP